MSDRIFVFGASGHAKVVIDAARTQGYEVAAVFDDDPALAGTQVLGCSVAGGRDELPAWCRSHGVMAGIVGIGNNRIRATVAQWLVGQGFRLASVVHPRATVAAGVTIGAGSVLMAGTVVNPDAIIGANCIVNTGATVDHDCVLGEAVHIAPGCHLCGHVRVGAGSLLGAGAVAIPGVTIGADVLVGAGSTVLADIPDGLRVAGSPACPIK